MSDLAKLIADYNYSNRMRRIPGYIAEAGQKRGMSQAELAVEMNVNEKTIIDLEIGKIVPTQTQKRRLGEMLFHWRGTVDAAPYDIDLFEEREEKRKDSTQ